MNERSDAPDAPEKDAAPNASAPPYDETRPYIGPGPEPTVKTAQRLFYFSLAAALLNPLYHLYLGAPFFGIHIALQLLYLLALIWLIYWLYFGVLAHFIPQIKAQSQRAPIAYLRLGWHTYFKRLLLSAFSLGIIITQGWQLFSYRSVELTGLSPGLVWVHPRQPIESGVVGDHEGVELAHHRITGQGLLLRLGALDGPYFVHRVGTGKFRNCNTRLLDMGLSWIFRFDAKAVSWQDLQPSPTCERNLHRLPDDFIISDDKQNEVDLNPGAPGADLAPDEKSAPEAQKRDGKEAALAQDAAKDGAAPVAEDVALESAPTDQIPEGSEPHSGDDGRPPEGSEPQPGDEGRPPEGSGPEPSDEGRPPEGSGPEPGDEGRPPEGSGPEPGDEGRPPEGSGPEPGDD